MCLLDENDLFQLVNDEKLFAVFTLTEREKEVLRAHILHNQSFASIAAIYKISSKRAHDIYAESIRKMKKTIRELLEKQSGN